MNNCQLENAIRRIRKGDTAAFETIVRRFERPLRAWLATHAPPGIDVDEVAQKSFVAAFARLSDYELGTNFAAWLFTIARFQLKTEMSRLRRVALGGLGEHLHRFIKWRYVEEIPLEEMAARSGRSVAAVKKQLWKLRRKLHECVEVRMTAQGEPT